MKASEIFAVVPDVTPSPAGTDTQEDSDFALLCASLMAGDNVKGNRLHANKGGRTPSENPGDSAVVHDSVQPAVAAQDGPSAETTGVVPVEIPPVDLDSGERTAGDSGASEAEIADAGYCLQTLERDTVSRRQVAAAPTACDSIVPALSGISAVQGSVSEASPRVADAANGEANSEAGTVDGHADGSLGMTRAPAEGNKVPVPNGTGSSGDGNVEEPVEQVGTAYRRTVPATEVIDDDVAAQERDLTASARGAQEEDNQVERAAVPQNRTVGDGGKSNSQTGIPPRESGNRFREDGSMRAATDPATAYSRGNVVSDSQAVSRVQLSPDVVLPGNSMEGRDISATWKDASAARVDVTQDQHVIRSSTSTDTGANGGHAQDSTKGYENGSVDEWLKMISESTFRDDGLAIDFVPIMLVAGKRGSGDALSPVGKSADHEYAAGALRAMHPQGMGSTAEARLSRTERPVDMPSTMHRVSQVIDSMDKYVMTMVHRNPHTMVVDLSPPNLGKLTLNCHVDGSTLNLKIDTEHAGVRDFIATHEQHLREVVEQTGYKLGGFDVRAGNQETSRQARDRAESEREDNRSDVRAGRIAGSTEDSAGEVVATGGRLWLVA